MAVFSYANKYAQDMAFKTYSSDAAVLTKAHFDFGTEWCQVRYNSAASTSWLESAAEVPAAAPLQLIISSSFKITNDTSSAVTYQSVYIDFYKGTTPLGSGSIGTVTVPANSSVDVSADIILENPKYNYPNVSYIEEYVYSQNTKKHPYYCTESNFTCPGTFKLRYYNGKKNVNLGSGVLTDQTFAFTLPTIYDCRACSRHLTGNSKYKGVSSLTVSPTTDISSTVIEYTKSSDFSASYDLENMHYLMPEMEVRNGSDVIFNSSNFEVAPKERLSGPPQVAFTDEARTLLCSYLRETGSRDSTTYSFNAYKRNPFKKGDLALGSLVFLDDDYCYTVTSNQGSGYYDSEWYLLNAEGQSFTLTPTNIKKKISAYGSIEINYTLQNPVKLGCFYTEYTYPSLTVDCTVDWMVKNVSFSPSGTGWVDTPSVTVEAPLPTTDTQTLTYTITQPAAYLASFVSGNTSKSVTLGATVTSNIGESYTVSLSTVVYKFVNLEITEKEGYRCTQAGVRNVNGSYLGYLATYNGYNMGGYNPITAHMKIVTLVNGETVYDSDISLTSGKIWVSDSSFVDDETSYKLTLTLSDKFRTRVESVNIGTKVAYIEWGDEPGHIAIGKYIETNGFEVQFPTQFDKAVIFLTTGSNVMGDAAAAIPYTDTYSVGATTVQEALNWILGRLS